ncbi:transcriptional regulator of the spore photoproduct lyase operon [Aquisalibacillus elongatus]|uniref:Transcriptional regulator of the spore photoproduct lyase operon n=1 Tax=Aquisalibacillus elongatus TaxID=485577 RepID=A0A3N5CDZ0_9BACI|nr:transcriptional regulator of the spore photoproduct lyase operon [Aquisalibacillus elongatus]
MNLQEDYEKGDIVYVMYRNPHAQSVAQIQEAAVVQHPEEPGELALFFYDTYYPLNEQIAVYKTEEEANEAYQFYFGDADGANYYG